MVLRWCASLSGLDMAKAFSVNFIDKVPVSLTLWLGVGTVTSKGWGKA